MQINAIVLRGTKEIGSATVFHGISYRRGMLCHVEVFILDGLVDLHKRLSLFGSERLSEHKTAIHAILPLPSRCLKEPYRTK